jgi:O-antigen/teichoic acid export membrane protein
LNSTIGSVAFPALSRVQDDPVRLKSYFLKGYSLFLTLVMPITLGCMLFSEDIVRVFLGPKWHDAAPIFRLMAPTILVFALINPLAWLMLASGHAVRSLKIALMIAPAVVLSYVVGLKYGPHGVALGFSIAMVALVVPVVAWAKHGTLITGIDILKTVMMPFSSIIIGAAAAWAASGIVGRLELAFPRLVAECAVLFGVYLIVLLFVMKQKAIYAGLLRETGLWPLRGGRK